MRDFDPAWWLAGMDVLLDMLNGFASPKNQQDGALALCTLARKANALSPIDAAPLPPTPQVCPSSLTLIIHSEQCPASEFGVKSKFKELYFITYPDCVLFGED